MTHRHRRHQERRRYLPAAARDRVTADEDCRTVAEDLQKTHGGWLIFWSPWRRAFTAIPTFTREAFIIDEAMVNALLDRIHDIEEGHRQRLP